MNSFETHINEFERAYFIGIGGIGMSALARYFKSKGWDVAGYDKTPTTLTGKLIEEGIEVHFEDLGPSLPTPYKEIQKTLVIYTPAIPKNLGELLHVQHSGYSVFKRSQVLGMITRDSKAIGIAGTHGKTTTSTMMAHILNVSDVKCSAFLGGISTNYNSNFIESESSNITVIEADEFDRSFLQLSPFAGIITSTDADHLDIYGNDEDFQKGFQEYAKCISPDGFLIRQYNVAITSNSVITYGINCSNADFNGFNFQFNEGVFTFDLESTVGLWKNVELGIPGLHNAENAIACIAMALQFGIDELTIREALKSFAGVKRRFEYQIKTPDLVYIDDYAHHPTEINALISSIKLLYPNKSITGIFQPHLFSRTRDFFDGFVKELSRLDEVILLPIYPAREEPIAGITSAKLLEKITAKKKQVLDPEKAIKYVSIKKNEIVLTIGAGDIDRIVEPLKIALLHNEKMD